jgi:uncharacterized surface protein with fasciclin (FAS1) repeats
MSSGVDEFDIDLEDEWDEEELEDDVEGMMNGEAKHGRNNQSMASHKHRHASEEKNLRFDGGFYPATGKGGGGGKGGGKGGKSSNKNSNTSRFLSSVGSTFVQEGLNPLIQYHANRINQEQEQKRLDQERPMRTEQSSRGKVPYPRQSTNAACPKLKMHLERKLENERDHDEFDELEAREILRQEAINRSEEYGAGKRMTDEQRHFYDVLQNELYKNREEEEFEENADAPQSSRPQSIASSHQGENRGRNIMNLLDENENLSTFTGFVRMFDDLVDHLREEKCTVFAPNNGSFEGYLLEDLANTTRGLDIVKKIIESHIVVEGILKTQGTFHPTALFGIRLAITKNNGSKFVQVEDKTNGISKKEISIQSEKCSDHGCVYVISELIIPLEVENSV